MALGMPPVCGETANEVAKIMKTMKMAMPLYSLLTRGNLRLDLAAKAPGASCINV